MSINNNPFFQKNINFDEAIPFDIIKADHFVPAIKEAIKLAKIYIEEISYSSEAPTFENTVLALENSSEYLEIVASTYYHLFSALKQNRWALHYH